MEPPAEDLADRLAALYPRLEQPPGVMLGVHRLPILDPILDELEASLGVGGASDEASSLPGATVLELERLLELLATEMLGTAPETVPRRVRIVDLLRRSDGGRLPVLAADLGDPFGQELRAMLESDDDLRRALGHLHPLIARATSVAPSSRWIGDARDLLAAARPPADLTGATRRVLAALVRAEIVSRPDLLLGGIRPANQRLARGVLWFASVAVDTPANTLGTVGLRMGTSGRSDAVVRDTALANTCAALLGEALDPAAPAALASMRSQVTNRNVLKQVDRALETQAMRVGMSVDDLVDRSLPGFGLDERGRLEIAAGPATAIVEVGSAGDIAVRWRRADGREEVAPPADLASAEPAAVAHVAATVTAIEAAIAEERRRLEDRLGSLTWWPIAAWRRRFADHPVAGPLGRRLVWVLEQASSETSALIVDGRWIGLDDGDVIAAATARVRLWHPAEARAGERPAWQATLAARAVRQPFRQVDRETFLPAPGDIALAADLRFAGRIVDHPRLRAALRQRGWAVPALGAWDQGDEATAWRAFADGLRAELRYQLPSRVPTGERVERARIIAVRFVRTEAAPASPAVSASSVPLTDLPLRIFSEALRDVSLSVAEADPPPDR